MKTFIVGANGGIGRILSEQLSDEDDLYPEAMIRDESQKAYFDEIGVPTSLGDLNQSVDELAELFSGSGAIVFTAGSGGGTGYDATLEIDLDGAVKCIEAAEKAGVKRFVMVSVLHADDRAAWESSPIKPYMIAKHYADRALKNSSLDYLILRPGSLTDEPGTGKVATGPMVSENNSIPREDVASVITESLKDGVPGRSVMGLVSGDTDITVRVAINDMILE